MHSCLGYDLVVNKEDEFNYVLVVPPTAMTKSVLARHSDSNQSEKTSNDDIQVLYYYLTSTSKGAMYTFTQN